MIQFDKPRGFDCDTCMGGRNPGEPWIDLSCQEWKTAIRATEPCDGRYYAHREQVEVMLKWKEDALKNKRKFKIGDKVTVLIRQHRKITNIMDDVMNYPICIEMEDGKEITCTSEGKMLNQNTYRSVFHGHDLEIEVKEKFPIEENWIVNGFVKMYESICEIPTTFNFTSGVEALQFIKSSKLEKSNIRITSDPIRIENKHNNIGSIKKTNFRSI